MAVFSVHVYRPLEGRAIDMLATMGRAKEIVEANGGICSIWQPITGGDAGTFAFVDAYDGAGSYGRTMDALRASDDFRALSIEIATKPSGVNVENFSLVDIDATLGLPTEPSTVLYQVVHRTIPGKAAAHMAATQTALEHLTRLGARARAMRVVGRGSGVATVLGFSDYTHYGEFGEKIAVDEQWNAFFGGLAADPPAEETESSLAGLVQLP